MPARRPGLLFLAVLLGACGGGDARNSAPDTLTAAAAAGPREPTSPMQLWVPGASWVFLAASEDDFNALLDAQNSGDPDRVRALVVARRAVMVPNGVEVRVADRGVLKTGVVVLEPGRVYTNATGYIQSDFVRPRAAAAATGEAAPAVYTVLDRIGTTVEVLIPSLAVGTPQDSLRRVAEQVAAREGATTLYLYRTREAQRANGSAAYGRAHPTALKAGFLGWLDSGTWRPPL